MNPEPGNENTSLRARQYSAAWRRGGAAASAPLAPKYRPRQPHKTVLRQIVCEHLQTMLAEASLRTEDGRGYPRFVERELRRYIERQPA